MTRRPSGTVPERYARTPTPRELARDDRELLERLRERPHGAGAAVEARDVPRAELDGLPRVRQLDGHGALEHDERLVAGEEVLVAGRRAGAPQERLVPLAAEPVRLADPLAVDQQRLVLAPVGTSGDPRAHDDADARRATRRCEDLRRADVRRRRARTPERAPCGAS